MCEYDNDGEHISDSLVTTRKPHECGSCMKDWPAGTRMTVSVGKCDGVLYRNYGCPICCFALAQKDHSAFHLCWGWNWSSPEYREDGSRDDELWDYLKWCHDNNESPTETAWAVVVKQHRDAEEAA